MAAAGCGYGGSQWSSGDDSSGSCSLGCKYGGFQWLSSDDSSGDSCLETHLLYISMLKFCHPISSCKDLSDQVSAANTNRIQYFCWRERKSACFCQPASLITHATQTHSFIQTIKKTQNQVECGGIQADGCDCSAVDPSGNDSRGGRVHGSGSHVFLRPQPSFGGGPACHCSFPRAEACYQRAARPRH